MTEGSHERASCLNQYELIRKFRRGTCRRVTICACGQAFGRRLRYAPVAQGQELEFQIDVPGDLGFVLKVPPSAEAFQRNVTLWT